MKKKKLLAPNLGVPDELVEFGQKALSEALKERDPHVMKKDPSKEEAGKYIEQCRYMFSRVYEMFCNFVENTIPDVTKTTESDFDVTVYKFAMVIVPALEKEFPEVVNAFIEPLLPDDEKTADVVRSSILSYCGNLIVQPLVLAVATRFLEHRNISFKTSGKANNVVVN